MPTTTQTKLEDKILAVLDANHICSFATIDGDKPIVRYMVLHHEGLKLYVTTSRKTDKVDELKTNPHVHVLVGYDGKPSSQILQIQATAEVSSNQILRDKLWSADMKKWFDGPQDPNYVILEITPTNIQYVSDTEEPQVWQP
ncbi:pyridoxamine 5'-phosphate oxidase family protein [Paenibacillus whitsoniae]|uniref:General stress protein n=1 Tax=Paenibacillus whitsoniae TaxID=2496558 RepID=A0A430J4K7_9BACL|nr:pyridoxamine 5'-phosphate oxidase family protein [Paenibacillus whitsoniae]RTE00729.1 general stress protein [Paenibacillus whitsoniae]